MSNIPIPKLRALDSKRGFFVDLAALLAEPGAGAGFLPEPGLDLGGWSLRREHSQSRVHHKDGRKRSPLCLGALALCSKLSESSNNESVLVMKLCFRGHVWPWVAEPTVIKLG